MFLSLKNLEVHAEIFTDDMISRVEFSQVVFVAFVLKKTQRM